MKTYRISEEEIKGMEPVATGYKIFRNDWTSDQGYDYKDENGNVLGTIHKVDGNMKECRWGLHFSKKPQDCFNFYECVQWNKFAKVEAYDKCIDSSDGDKSVANIIKIVEVYTFNEFAKLIQENLQSNYSNGVNGSKGVNGSDGVNASYGVNGSYGVNWSKGVNGSKGVNWSDGVNDSYGVNWSDGVNASYGVNRSDGVNGSYGVNWSDGVNASYGVNGSDGVNASYGVNRSYGVNGSYGVNWSKGVNWSGGVNDSYGVTKCEGISRSLFCYNKSGKLMAFNKKITKERFKEIYNRLEEFNWYPKFNNAEELKGNLEWYEVKIPSIVEVDNKTAWSFMPKEMLKYIRSLPEFNQEIFDKVTGDIKEDD